MLVQKVNKVSHFLFQKHSKCHLHHKMLLNKWMEMTERNDEMILL